MRPASPGVSSGSVGGIAAAAAAAARDGKMSFEKLSLPEM